MKNPVCFLAHREQVSGWAFLYLPCLFITKLERLPETFSEFAETFWGSLMDYVTVGKDKTMVFTLIGGTEMKE